jgi:DNA-directed RNA polymerase subunit RPC12/RpoP
MTKQNYYRCTECGYEWSQIQGGEQCPECDAKEIVGVTASELSSDDVDER